MKSFVEGQTVYVADFYASKRRSPMIATYRYAGDFGEHWTDGGMFRDHEIFDNARECGEFCRRHNERADKMANMSDEEYNDYEFRKYLNRFFRSEDVEEMIEVLHEQEDYGELEIKVTDAYSGDGKREVYYHRFSSPTPGAPVIRDENKRLTKKEKEEQYRRSLEMRKKLFLGSWTRLCRENIPVEMKWYEMIPAGEGLESVGGYFADERAARFNLGEQLADRCQEPAELRG